MPKDRDEGNKRIEGIFGQIGLGNLDPEKLTEFLETYERTMETASQVKQRTGKKKFKDILESQPEEEESDKNEPEEGEKPK